MVSAPYTTRLYLLCHCLGNSHTTLLTSINIDPLPAGAQCRAQPFQVIRNETRKQPQRRRVWLPDRGVLFGKMQVARELQVCVN